jgi:hypothetical protein
MEEERNRRITRTGLPISHLGIEDESLGRLMSFMATVP